MTREEKLQKAHQMFDDRELLIELKWQREYFKRGYVSSQEELFNLWIFDECIKALQEPCEDAISRAELLEAMDTYDKFGYTETGCFVRAPKNDYVPYVHYDDMVNCVKGMPSVTPQEPKTGHWIEEFNDLEGEVRFTCSSCGKYQLFGTDYCYNCGTKMVELQESEDEE